MTCTRLLRAADARAWRGTLPMLLLCDTGYLAVLPTGCSPPTATVMGPDRTPSGPDALATMGVVVCCGFLVVRARWELRADRDVVAQLRCGPPDDRCVQPGA